MAQGIKRKYTEPESAVNDTSKKLRWDICHPTNLIPPHCRQNSLQRLGRQRPDTVGGFLTRSIGPVSVKRVWGQISGNDSTPAPVTESTPGQKRKPEHSLRYYLKRHKADTVASDKPIAVLQKRKAEEDAPDAPPISKKVRVQDTEGKKCEDSEKTVMVRAANTTVPTPKAVPTAIPKPTAAPIFSHYPAFICPARQLSTI